MRKLIMFQRVLKKKKSADGLLSGAQVVTERFFFQARTDAKTEKNWVYIP